MDEDGTPIVRVELVNRRGVFATVDEADFNRLLDAGFSPRWCLNESAPGFFYVRCYQGGVAGKLGVVARLVAEAGRGRQIKYRNGNTLDLRSRNLLTARAGWAKGQTPLRDEFAPSARVTA